jgi:hypothetical protein
LVPVVAEALHQHQVEGLDFLVEHPHFPQFLPLVELAEIREHWDQIPMVDLLGKLLQVRHME